jgi:superoxide oxidase
MTTNLKTRDETEVGFDSQDDRFDRTSIILHWVTVLLITIQFTSIWARETIGHQSGLAPLLLSLHRAMGLLTWTVVAARLIWRRYFAHVPDFPANMPIVQQLVAKANEHSLYIMLLAVPATGLARALLRGRPLDLLIWQVPALMNPHPAWQSMFAEAHEACATVLMLLIGLHIGAALFHHAILRDDVLQRMTPELPSRKPLMPASRIDRRE